MGICSAAKGTQPLSQPECPEWGQGIGGAPFLCATQALESGALMAAGLHSSLMSRAWKGPPFLVREKAQACLPVLCSPSVHGGTCLSPDHFHKLFCQENQIPLAPDSKDPEQPSGKGGEGTPNPTGADVEPACLPYSPLFPHPVPNFSPGCFFFYDCKHR